VGYLPAGESKTGEYSDNTMSRNFKIALAISTAVHIFWMSAIVIVGPAEMEKVKPYTSVDFLGPLLQKTAFDIMLEGINPSMRTTYAHVPVDDMYGNPRAESPERRALMDEFSKHHAGISDRFAVDFLNDDKSIPGFLLETRESAWKSYGSSENKKDRRIVYRPAVPDLPPGLHRSGDTFRIKIRAMVSDEGNVRRTEPVTTTGYPELDIKAAKYVSSWIFEPGTFSDADRWVEVDVVLKAGDSHD